MPWVEENGIIAQVIGGAPSLISDLINLVKHPLCFTRNVSQGMLQQRELSRMSLFIRMRVIRANNIPKESAAEGKNKTINRRVLCELWPAIS